MTGEKLEFSGLRFARLRKNERGELYGYTLYWEARYRVKGTLDVRYDLCLEPFSGGLIAIHRRPANENDSD